MKTYIPKESPPFDRNAEREPRHNRQEQQPKRPKRPSEAHRLAPRNTGRQRQWSCKQQHKGSPQPQCCCHNRHFASNASVAARPVHVTVNAFKSRLSKQAWSAQRSIAGSAGTVAQLFGFRRSQRCKPIALTAHPAEAFQVLAEYRIGRYAVLQTPELKVEFYRSPFRETINRPFSMSLSLD